MRSRTLARRGAAAILTITLAACSSATDRPTSQTPTGQSATGAPPSVTDLPDGYADGLRLTYLSAPLGDATYATVACGALLEAKRLGAKLDHQESQEFSASSQIPTLNAAATTQPDGLLVTPTDPNGLIAPLRVVKQDGIPVVTVVNELANTNGINAEVAVDNLAAGRTAAKLLGDAAGGQEVTIASFGFTAGGSLASDDEIKGFEEVIHTYPNVTYLGAQYVGSDPADSTQAMNGLLARQPDLFGVFTAFGESADGMLASLRQRNAKVKIVSGYGATNNATVEGMRKGDVIAIVDFPFQEVGKVAVDTIARIAKNESVPASFKYPSVTYTQASFTDPKQASELGRTKCPV